LLLLPTSGVKACYEDHKPGAGWFDEQTGRRPHYGSFAEAVYRDRLMDLSLIAGASGIAILVGVFIRARCQATRHALDSYVPPATRAPLAESINQPTWEPLSTELSVDFQDRGCGSSGSFSIDAQPLTSVFLSLDALVTSEP
jgi:hypothetical protein